MRRLERAAVTLLAAASLLVLGTGCVLSEEGLLGALADDAALLSATAMQGLLVGLTGG